MDTRTSDTTKSVEDRVESETLTDKLMNVSSSSEDTDLLRYIENEILTSQLTEEKKVDKTYIAKGALKILLCSFGAGWGLPWRDASYDTGKIFASDSLKEIFGQLFSYGIVVTVGIDGLWVMLEVSQDYLKKSTELENNLTSSSKSNATRIISGIAALLSSISAVYASVKYSNGKNKFYSIITLVGNVGYGYYGYSKLSEKLIQKIRDKNQEESLLKLREQLVKQIDYVLKNGLTPKNEIKSIQDLINYLDTSMPSDNNVSKGKQAFQMFFSLVLPVCSSAVTISLTKDAIKNNIYDENWFAYLFSVIADVPGFVVSQVSTHRVFGQLYDTLSCAVKRDCKSILIGSTAFAFSLLAPSAACYITYNTLLPLSEKFAWFSTISIGLARVVFSNYTVEYVLENAINYLNAKCFAQEKNIDPLMAKLPRLKDTLSKVPLDYLSTLPKPSSKNKSDDKRVEPLAGSDAIVTRKSTEKTGLRDNGIFSESNYSAFENESKKRNSICSRCVIL